MEVIVALEGGIEHWAWKTARNMNKSSVCQSSDVSVQGRGKLHVNLFTECNFFVVIQRTNPSTLLCMIKNLEEKRFSLFTCINNLL